MHPKRKLFQKRKSNKRDKKRTTRKSKRSTQKAKRSTQKAKRSMQKAKRSTQKAKRGGAPGDYITEKDFNDIVGKMDDYREKEYKIQVTYDRPASVNTDEDVTIEGIFAGSDYNKLYIIVDEGDGKVEKLISILTIKNGGIKILN